MARSPLEDKVHGLRMWCLFIAIIAVVTCLWVFRWGGLVVIGAALAIAIYVDARADVWD